MAKTTRIAGALLVGAALWIVPAAASAQQLQIYSFDMSAQDLGDALRAVAARAGWELYAAAEDVNGVQAPPLNGNLTARQAIEQLLRGTNLTARFSDGAVIIRVRSKFASATEDLAESDEIVVTGTHIPRSEPTSPVISSTREEIRKSGRTDLGEYIRDLPQNFGGGQNPGIVGGGVQGGNENLASTSALNLRGLGPDATLTLINGHRVAYDRAIQGVDISAIPLAAVDRIEIIADGSSALYGSDAVAGVANVILRSDFDGLWTSARVAGATDGGDFQQQYEVVTGSRWRAGGFMLAAGYDSSSEVTARQRSFTQRINGSTTLLPAQTQYTGVFNGFQEFSDAIELDLDAQYSRRESHFSSPLTVTSDARTNGNIYSPTVESYSATPSLIVSLPSDWKLDLSGTFGRSLTEAPGQSFSGGTLVSSSYVYYDNRLRSIELRGDGTLFRLPGGDVGLAVGAGYRGFSLDAKSHIDAGPISISVLNIHHEENVAFAFGEIAAPLFGASNRRSMLDFLQLSAAVRYERYANLASVASPKIGIVYRPFASVTIKGSWGKSFKAPTFYQRYKTYQALLINAADFGETGSNAGRAVLYLAGGNPDLMPERASTWNVSLTYAPATIPSLRLEANYFNIRYRNRVVNPVTSVLGLFENPIYSTLVTYSPTPALLDELIAPAAGAFGLQNFTGKPYDPSTVYAVVDARSQNTAYQAIQGVDLIGNYQFDLGSESRLKLSATATYIDSKRRLIAGQAASPGAGVLFMPPNWRSRGGAVFEQGNVFLSGFVNYVGGVRDNRIEPELRVEPFVSADVAARISGTDTSGVFSGVDLTIAVSNLFNEKPAIIRTSSLIDPPYDSANYSALGRIISITLAKRW